MDVYADLPNELKTIVQEYGGDRELKNILMNELYWSVPHSDKIGFISVKWILHASELWTRYYNSQTDILYFT